MATIWDGCWWMVSLAGLCLFLAWVRSLFRAKKLLSRNKAVLITGCDTGFGHDLAICLSKLNYRVFAGCLFIDGEGANALKSCPGVEVVRLDVTKNEDILCTKRDVSDRLGDDVLWAIVNNAGIITFGELEWCPTEVIMKVFDVNTLGMIRVTKAFLPLLKRPKGRIINITSISGCDSGFGHMLSKRLAELGYKVFAGCLVADGEGAKELKSFSPSITVLRLDVTDDRSVENAAKVVSEGLDGNDLWAIVNNAGITHSSEMEWTPLQTIMNVFNVNTFGMVRVTQQFLPFLKKSKGRIVNVTSITAELRFVGFGGYVMSKVAAKSFNDIIRVELKKWGIRVINVAPYFYGTNITDDGKVVSMMRSQWEQCPLSLKKELGDQYIERSVDIAKEFLKRATNPYISEVVDCLEDGITSVSPKLCYRPGSITSKFLHLLISYCPTSLEDSIHFYYMPPIKK